MVYSSVGASKIKVVHPAFPIFFSWLEKGKKINDTPAWRVQKDVSKRLLTPLELHHGIIGS